MNTLSIQGDYSKVSVGRDAGPYIAPSGRMAPGSLILAQRPARFVVA